MPRPAAAGGSFFKNLAGWSAGGLAGGWRAFLGGRGLTSNFGKFGWQAVGQAKRGQPAKEHAFGQPRVGRRVSGRG